MKTIINFLHLLGLVMIVLGVIAVIALSTLFGNTKPQTFDSQT